MRITKLASGQQYGNITLVAKLEEKDKHGAFLWLCVCICGKEKLVSSGKVRRGDSCGCVAKNKNEKTSLVGKRYGKLIILERLSKIDKWGSRLYLCQCDCGNKKEMFSHGFVGGNVKSCGCLLDEYKCRKLPFGESALNQLYATYRLSAVRRDIPFSLVKEKFQELTKLNCHYCGNEPNQRYQPKRHNGFYIYNGIDRLNSSEGYYEENCVASCGKCNRMKMDMSTEDFIKHICKIAHKLSGG